MNNTQIDHNYQLCPARELESGLISGNPIRVPYIFQLCIDYTDWVIAIHSLSTVRPRALEILADFRQKFGG
jgi:hypothetical protein